MKAGSKNLLFSAAIIPLLSGAAAAQSVPSSALSQSNNPPSTADPASNGDIIVTAQRRSEPLQQVPATINVVSAQQLEQFHATQLTDLVGYVPGLQVDDGGTPGQTQIAIRGIPPLGAGATVATYVDDTPLGFTGFHERGGQYSADLLPYDVQQVEVLAGPQGTLYGANALGGLLKYDLVRPSLTKSTYRVGGDVLAIHNAGDPGGGGRAQANVALIPDRLGLIASYGIERTPGYIDNIVTGRKGQNPVTQQAARVGVLWQASPNLSVEGGWIYQRTKADGNATVAFNVDGDGNLHQVGGDLTDNNALPNTYSALLSLFNVSVKWDLHWARLISATSWATKQDNVSIDQTATFQDILPLLGNPAIFGPGALGSPGPANGLAAFDLYLKSHRFTQEVRLNSPDDGGPLTWGLGAYYDNEHASNTQIVTGQAADQTSLAAIGDDPQFFGQLPVHYREYAGFANGSYRFTSKLELGGGVRWARNMQDFTEILPPSPQVGPTSPLAGTLAGHSAESVWTWSVTPRIHFTPNIMLFGNVSTGYQSGGPNTAVPGAPTQVGSSTITNYEVGLKSSFDHGREVFNLSLFKLDWANIQVPASTSGGFTYITNGGTATSKGVEASGHLELLAGLSLNGSVTYTDAKLTQDALSVGGHNGDRLPYIPRWQGALRADYRQHAFGDWNVIAGAGVKYQSSRYSVSTTYPANSPMAGSPLLDGTPVRAYAAADATIGLADARYTFRIFAKNLTDNRVYTTQTPYPDGLSNAPVKSEGTVLQPRTIGLSADVRF